MLRRIIRFCVFAIYAACTLGILGVLVKISSNDASPFPILLIIVECLGFLIGLAELYLLHRNRIHEAHNSEAKSTHVYVFIGEESLETSRISLLSLKYLRGAPKVTVLCTSERFEIESLCNEFGFEYFAQAIEFDSTSEHYLFTNGHTIIYPDAILVGERRLGSEVSYVELNHSVYSSHALGNNNVGIDASRASLLSSAAGSFSVPIYTGGPILVQSSSCNFEAMSEVGNPAPNFAEAVAKAASSGQRGTITSHPCCECMSHNEIDHNISSRTARVKVSRLLHRHPQYIDTASGIVRRYLAWYYVRFFWLRSCAFVIAAGLVLYAMIFKIPSNLISPNLFLLFIGAQVSSFLLSRLRGDARRPIERLRDSVLDCEAFIHSVLFRIRKADSKSHFRIRFVPFYLTALLISVIFRVYQTPRSMSLFDSGFRDNFFTLAVGIFVVVTLYKAMYRYLSARQRAFARRNVSITGSSSYESMWIVDLTHRGAAYISDSRLDVGEETPLVFRIPSMHGDSLITVVGKVTYCAPRGTQYQVGVSFKELSQQSQDDLTLYCSVIYPYHQARNIAELKNVQVSIEKEYNKTRDPRRNALSFSIYSFSILVLLMVGFTTLPMDSRNQTKTKVIESQNIEMKTESAYLANSESQKFSSLGSLSDSKNLVSISSTIFVDFNNDGVRGTAEPGISNASLSLYNSNGKQINAGPDGVLGNADDSKSSLRTGSNGEFTFRLINSGNYYIILEDVPSRFQISDGSYQRTKLTSTSSGYRTKIFSANEKNNGNLSAISIGFVDKYDLGISQEIISNNIGGVVPGDVVSVRVTVKNGGPGSAKSGFRVRTFLGEDFAKENISMVNTLGFSPCGFDGEKVECVSTKELAAGTNKTIEFNVISNVGASSTSSRRHIRSTVQESGLDHTQSDENSLVSNNSVEGVVTVGLSTAVGDRVFFDANANGLLDPGEPGIEGVRIGLLQFKDVNGDGIKDPGETPEVANDVSDNLGYFGVSSGKSSFQNLTPNAQYSLVYSRLPKNLSVTKSGQGGDASYENSDFVTSGKSTRWFTLGKNEINTGIDLGLVTISKKLSNKIFVDSNENRLFDKSESVVPDLDVALFRWVDGDSDGTIDSGESSNVPVAVTKSDIRGDYEFVGIRDSIFPTYYFVEANISEGFKLNDVRSKSSLNLSSKNKRTAPLTSKEFNDLSPLALIEKGASVNGFVWSDFNLNSTIDMNERGVSRLDVKLVSLKGRKTYSALTNRKGEYYFEGVASGKYFLGVEIDTIPKGFEIGGIGSRKITESISGRTDISLEVELNDTVEVRDLSLLPSASVRGTIYEQSKSSSEETLVALSNSEVELRNGDRTISRTFSDNSGNFEFKGLVPDIYEVLYHGMKDDHKTSIELIPGSTSLPNSFKNQSFSNSIFKGDWSEAKIGAAENQNIYNSGLALVLFAALGAFVTLARRGKLIYRNI